MTYPPENMLQLFRVHNNCYAIGPFFADGVTILKQQVRALNLVYALAKTGVIRNLLDRNQDNDDPRSVAVIGAGVAGMTAAAALKVLGNDVYHFDQRPTLCHLQSGCDTRSVHPHIYDWPEPGAESPYAGLPLLNWQAGTAAQVARRIVRDYERIRSQPKGSLTTYLGASTFLTGNTVKWDNSCKSKPRGGQKTFDVAILATGFGVERGVRTHDWASYWRNDSLNQLTPGVRSESVDLVFVSGTGDGGFIDLLRAKIEDFNQDTIIDDVFKGSASAILKERLKMVRDRHSVRPPAHRLYQDFEEIATSEGALKDEFKQVVKSVYVRLRDDVSAILNGTQDVFHDTLSLSTASLLNNFLIFVLYGLRGFTYIPGRLTDYSSNELVVLPRSADRNSVSRYTVSRAIIRHGTERRAGLSELGVAEPEIDSLSGRQSEFQSSLRSSTPSWDAGFWYESSRDVLRRRREGPKEFLPPPSQALASTFAATLSELLRATLSRRTSFRLTVHRVLQVREPEYYQQVSPYWGTEEGRWRDGEPGRIFPIEAGVVGLAARRGVPIVLNRREQTWKAVWGALNATDQNHMRGAKQDRAEVRALIAFPLFSAPQEVPHVSMIVYVETSTRLAPQLTGDLLKRISASSNTFIQNCDRLHDRGTLRFADGSYPGKLPQDLEEDRDLLRKYARDLIAAVRPYGNSGPSNAAKVCLHWDCVYKVDGEHGPPLVPPEIPYQWHGA